MRYAYYPGCTQETTGKEYGDSVNAVCRKLGIELEEIPDWSCCGASSAHSTSYWASHALPARNLAIAESKGMEIAVACPACYLRLKTTRHEYKTQPKLREKLPELINMPYEAKYEVRHLLDIMCNLSGIEQIKGLVSQPLTGLKVVPYYGCYLVRPPKISGFDDPENPQAMDRVLKGIGADVPDWRAKVDCCGGSLALTSREVVTKLVSGIYDAAREVEAEAIVTACALCHANLETRQIKTNPLPVFYFTELMGLAMGCDSRAWLKKHLISPFDVLKRHNLLK